MTFKINIIDEAKSLGEIQIDDFVERFEICPCYWDHQKYETKWLENLQSLLTEEVSSCWLITWMHEPNSEENYRAWILYKEADNIPWLDLTLEPPQEQKWTVKKNKASSRAFFAIPVMCYYVTSLMKYTWNALLSDQHKTVWDNPFRCNWIGCPFVFCSS